jgi:hypothetical protein
LTAIDLPRRRVFTPAWSLRWELGAWYVVALVPALVLAIAQPVWSRVDEAQHTDVLAQYEHGVIPREATTTIRPEIAAIMDRTGVYRWNYPGTLPQPAVTDPAQFRPIPSDLRGLGRNLWVRRHLWWFSYEAMQPPLFYLVATPVYMAGDALGGALTGMYLVRILNALVLALLAPMTYGLGRTALGADRIGAGLGAAMVALLPGLALNGSQVTNDTFVAVLGGAVVLLTVRAAKRGWTDSMAVLIGLTLGAALMSKLTAAGLAPMLALSLWRAGRLRTRTTLLLGATAAAACIPWIVFNLARYREPVPTAEVHQLLGQVFKARYDPVSLSNSINFAVSGFWAAEPVGTVVLTPLIILLGVAVLLAGLIGLSHISAPRPTLGLLAAAALGTIGWGFVTVLFSGLGGNLPGRYLYQAVVPLAAMVGFGLTALPRRRGLALMAAFGAVSVLAMALFAAGVRGDRGPDRSGVPGPQAGRPVTASGGFGPLSVSVDRAYISSEDRLWIHVHAVNSSDASVDWFPIPQAKLQDGTMFGGDYARSDPMPEVVPPLEERSGWVKLNAAPHGDRWTVRLMFRDIGVHDYHSVGIARLTLTG